jgi:hypothetical protein
MKDVSLLTPDSCHLLWVLVSFMFVLRPPLSFGLVTFLFHCGLCLSKVGWEGGVGMHINVQKKKQQTTNFSCCLSFGCHLTVGNMAP